jgi:hypothetical protein
MGDTSYSAEDIKEVESKVFPPRRECAQMCCIGTLMFILSLAFVIIFPMAFELSLIIVACSTTIGAMITLINRKRCE